MSMRLAMGAGRRRVLRQMLTESLLVSAMGGAAGLLLAYGVRNIIPRLLADPWGPPAFNATFDWGIFAFTAAVSVVTGIVFGLAPAWQATRVNVSAGLKEAAQTTHAPSAGARRQGHRGGAGLAFHAAAGRCGTLCADAGESGRARLGFRSDHLLLFDLNPLGNAVPGRQGPGPAPEPRR